MDTIPDMIFTEPHEWHYGALPKECRDLNGDGYPDIGIAGDFGDSFLITPEYYIYWGGPQLDNVADLILSPDTLSDYGMQYGGYSSMGDFNGDGYNDMIISAPSYEEFDSFNGKIFVYFGGAEMDTIPDWTVNGQINQISGLGYSVSCKGDVNNDGYEDILCSGNLTGSGVFARMLFLGDSDPDTLYDLYINGSSMPSPVNIGSTIIPDVNNDGCDEVLIGAEESFSCNGVLFYGGNNLDTLWDIHFNAWGLRQNGIEYIGDVNQDGYGDIAIGAKGDIYPYTGFINLFFLGPNMSVEMYYDYLLEGNGFGGKMDYAGDVNGDSVDDFLIGTSYEPTSIYPGEVFIYSDTTLVSVVTPEVRLSIPSFNMHQNYPNPFNASTTIPFTLDRAGKVNLNIYNISGQRIFSLGTRISQLGTHEVIWNAEGMASGVYIVRLETPYKMQSIPVILVK